MAEEDRGAKMSQETRARHDKSSEEENKGTRKAASTRLEHDSDTFRKVGRKSGSSR